MFELMCDTAVDGDKRKQGTFWCTVDDEYCNSYELEIQLSVDPDEVDSVRLLQIACGLGGEWITIGEFASEDSPLMRFVLEDEAVRELRAERWREWRDEERIAREEARGM